MSKRVAIACQGGGSHTAFTGGVLKGILDEDPDVDIVGFSGTSGGAVSALAAWYGLLTEGPKKACRLIDALWGDIAANPGVDRWVNSSMVAWTRAGNSGLPIPEVSPYQHPFSDWGHNQLRATLEQFIDFERIPDLLEADSPELVVGTVNVNAGEFETFADEEITVEAMLASTALPTLFPAVEIHGHSHWDGLFSQNPPIHDLLTNGTKPDEIWVVQINPQTRETEPKSLLEIHDRRNELAGNISMNQELRFIHTVNEWIEAGHLPREHYNVVRTRKIMFNRDLHAASKLDRSSDFLAELLELGERRGRSFIDQMRTSTS
ncbi:patatin-like phospholipase family protein [Haladaptatus sp. DYSN1]|uniref:patatin-like phospholipase family protein n=1 Tax=unclassified Haladaptatus TaxID=2622732 RepID=UPI0024075E82|nr:patatin-like phospholipase family protein [Haladaptatus sp. DYSN1]